jgi:uncharacterized protein YceK
MRRSIWAILVAVSLCGSGGCGTLLDAIVRDYHEGLGSGPRVYGGTRLDLEVLSGAPELVKGDPESQISPLQGACCVALWTIDLPVSAAADTLALPISIYAAHKRLTAPPTKGAVEPDSVVAPPSCEPSANPAKSWGPIPASKWSPIQKE